MKFFNVTSVDETKKIIKDVLNNGNIVSESKVDIAFSLGKILSRDVISGDYLPNYNRSTVDGYAVVASDVFCAGQTIPSFLKIIGKVDMGEKPTVKINNGECVQIATGGILPEGANGVVMVENVQVLQNELAVFSPIKTNENTVLKGEEIKPDHLIAKRGDKVSPFLIGVLAGLGITGVFVYNEPTVSIISTGDELVAIQNQATNGKIRDVNTYLLEAISNHYGFSVTSKTLIGDNPVQLKQAIENAVNSADIVLLSGGSSVGQKDYTDTVLQDLGKVLVHGIAQKPGKPTIISVVNDKLIVGLPGNPFASAVNYIELLIDSFYEMCSVEREYKLATVMENFPSTPGRLTIQPLRIVQENEELKAYPVFLKSAHLATVLRADGYTKINENTEGINVGDKVKVFSFFD